MTRLLLALAFTAAAAAPALAQDREAELEARVEQLMEEIDDLRRERNRLQDQMIESARRFDQAKRRLQERLDEMRAENLQLRRAAGEAEPAEPDPLDAPVSFAFDGTPLSDVEGALAAASGQQVRVADDAADAELTLVVRELPLRIALDLIACNARGPDGEPADLEWTAGQLGVVLRAAD